MEVRLEYMMPREVEEAKAACPTLYIPMGTIEWHGLHNILGLDTVKAHELCIRAALQGGGLVHPPLYGGVGGLSEPLTFIIDPEDSLDAHTLRPWLERLCAEAKRNGFKAVILLTGHYGAAQQIAVRDTAVRMTKLLDIPILGTPEYFLALDVGYVGDHAAYFETSIMMHLFPDKVDVNRLDKEPYQGVGGRDPKKFAKAEDGKTFCEAIIKRLTHLAWNMPSWDEPTRLQFLRAEQALVDRQMTLTGPNQAIWTAWRNIGNGAFKQYPELLTSGKFSEIIALTETL
ncbi:MAG TPA: creatininase family protein [Candidatus Hydrogenedentes bacterium]|nr:creatininase family protein [Candidatus Hydrogenedentota bacterium]